MFRKTLVLLALALTVTAAFAQSRDRAVASFPMSGSTVSGTVSAVAGNTVSIADGVVKIDISNAKVTGTIGVGSLIFAALSSSNVAPNAPLPAATVAVIDLPDATLTGPVQAIQAQTITVLGQTIGVDANTSFGGGHDVHGLGDVAVNDTVAVEAHVVNDGLMATRILVFAVPAHLPVFIHGTVKSIGASSWVITDNRGKDITVLVDAHTKIISNPKVGDTVEVLANIDASNNYVAISIMPVKPLPQVHLSGVVKSISATQWVIGPAAGLGPDFLVQVNAQTQIVGNPHVGDHVDVVVQPGPSGFVAVSITKK